MMMKKTTSALAVAALLGTGAASAATFQVDENTSFGLSANLGYSYVMTEENGKSETDLADNSSDLRFSGEHASDNGLTTSLYIELDALSTTKPDPFTGAEDGLTTDQAYVGLAGEFGSIQLGTDLSTYSAVDGLKDIDIWTGITGLGNGTENAVRYTFPSMGNLSGAVGINTFDDDSGGSKSGSSVHGSLTYDLGAASLSAAYDNRGGLADGNDEPIYGFGVQADLAGLDTRVTYEKDTNPDEEVTLTSIAGIYGVGKLSFFGVLQNVSGDEQADVTAALGSKADDDSITQTNFGVGYSVADNMSVYLENTQKGAVDDEGDATSISVFVGF